MKICTKCLRSLSKSEFYNSKRFGLTHWCKKCFADYHKKEKEQDPAAWAQYHKTKSRESYYRHHDEQKARLRDRGRTAESKQYAAEWRKTPKGKAKVARMNARRREHTRNDVPLSAADVQNLLIEQEYSCNICLRPFNDSLPYTLDHVIPASKGGTLKIGNVQLLCRPCNSRKNDRVQ